VRQGFGGYEEDTETGLDFAQARYMSAAQGRFTSVDPLLASGTPVNPKTWNRYAYTLNNPLRYVDPTGLVTEYLNNGHGPGGDAPKGGRPFVVETSAGIAGYLDELRENFRTKPDLMNYALRGDQGGTPTQHPDKRLVVVQESAELTITTRPADKTSSIIDTVEVDKDHIYKPVLNNFHFQFVLTRPDGTEIKDFTYDLDGTPINAATNLDATGNSASVFSVALFNDRPISGQYNVIIDMGGIQTAVQFSTTSRNGAIEINQGYNNRVSLPPRLLGVPITRAPR
jgi:RHS repeat-associated protein